MEEVVLRYRLGESERADVVERMVERGGRRRWQLGGCVAVVVSDAVSTVTAVNGSSTVVVAGVAMAVVGVAEANSVAATAVW